jgi:hypothetical protein
MRAEGGIECLPGRSSIPPKTVNASVRCREAHIWTGTSVAEDFTMRCPGGLDVNIRMLFQRQWPAPSAIELWFSEVITFHMSPSRENYDSTILDAVLFKKDDLIYWSDWGAWRPEYSDREGCTWIAARRLCWRDASGWMGDELRYVKGDAK